MDLEALQVAKRRSRTPVHGLAALALWLSARGFHGQPERLPSAGIIEQSVGVFPLVQGCPLENRQGMVLARLAPEP
jgi:hypothetical protein